MKRSDQVRTRRDFIDYDYVDDLDDETRAFLAKFTDEYYGGAIKKGDTEAIHYSEDPDEYDRLRKDCYNRNNQNNRCQYNLSKTTGKVKEIIECITTIDGMYNGGDHESFLIKVQDYLDEIEVTDKERAEILNEIRVFCNNG